MGTKKKTAPKAAGKKPSRSGSSARGKSPAKPQHSAAYENLVKDYGQALERLRKGDHEGALESFRTIAARCEQEPALGQRARTYAAFCERRLNPAAPEPADPEERYRAAVGLANEGDYEAAAELLGRALAERPDEPTYLYARASVHALRGAAESAADDLRRAIAGRPELRFQAVNDPDFDPVRDQAAFIDVIEPSPTGG